MKLIVGLGNPGAQYARSRHNLGFLVVDALAEKLGVDLRHDTELQAEFGRGNHGEIKLFIAKPMTFMNESGQSVQHIAHYYNIEAQDVWLVYDDIDIIFGEMKIKPFGSSAGHKGVQSVIDYFNTDKFPRFKLGIRPRPLSPEVSVLTDHERLGDYVLKPFSQEQSKELPEVINRSVEAIMVALERGLPGAMNEYN